MLPNQMPPFVASSTHNTLSTKYTDPSTTLQTQSSYMRVLFVMIYSLG